MSSESPRMRDYLEGLRRALPIMLGYVPVGFAFGVLAVKNNIPPALAVGMSLLMFSGSGQFVLASLWGAGAGILSVIAAVFIVNLRYLLMSAAESPWLAALPRCQRFLLGLGLTDETFVVHITALQRGWKLRLPTLYVCNSATYLSGNGQRRGSLLRRTGQRREAVGPGLCADSHVPGPAGAPVREPPACAGGRVHRRFVYRAQRRGHEPMECGRSHHLGRESGHRAALPEAARRA